MYGLKLHDIGSIIIPINALESYEGHHIDVKHKLTVILKTHDLFTANPSVDVPYRIVDRAGGEIDLLDREDS